MLIQTVNRIQHDCTSYAVGCVVLTVCLVVQSVSDCGCYAIVWSAFSETR